MGNKRGPYRLNRQNNGLVTRFELAQLLGCSRATLDDAEGRGFIPLPSHPAGPVRLLWHRSEVEAISQGLARMRAERRKRTYRPPAGLLSIGQLAKLFQRPRVTLYSWITRGLFPRGTVGYRGHLWYDAKKLPQLRRAYAVLMATWGKRKVA